MLFRSFQFPFTVIGLAAALLSAAAQACTLCIGFPQQSVTDYVIQSDCVALARPSPNDQFAFAPVEILKGVYRGETIDLLVDSVTRRELAAHDDRQVALVRDAKDGTWRSLGIVGGDYEAVLRRVVLLSSNWQGAEGRQQRVKFFLPLFGNDDPQIRELAYLEMGRAPYSVIEKLGRVVSRQDYASMLTAREYIEWRSLAILLLAQSNEPQDKRYILDSFQNAEQFELATNLSAWAAAAVEVEGTRAIDFVEQRYFRNANKSGEEIRAALSALSLHGAEGSIHLRDRIVASYGVLLEAHPEFAHYVARDLVAWERSEWIAALSRILATNKSLDFESKRVIRQYVRAEASVKELASVRD